MSVYASQGTGRRKTSVARVYLKNGKGDITVNGKSLDDYFNTKEQAYIVRQALMVTDSEKSYDILVNVHGGGKTGQAGAILHGLSRALVGVDENNLKPLRANGFMSRDSRMVERKKYGQRGARRKYQFSKR
ncbi:30S ribosomal protein S9 [Spirochaeta africana]|uniref:Small ribosomal subunit protein uS9 n=1 Tax=Spirochaeta africana (strain ATCC 700263 / DSM 8902 / Z-7692) TaxID=889378 RepID=H9UGX3_SPIAZ|nr:30S ribosomal protein S9 [Spirochaeta africana]AFG36766.1 ribosomal protein S9 [Spirochaeta africana DSM 8902]